MRAIKFRVPVTKYGTGEFVRFLYETLDHGCFAFNESMINFPNSLVIGEEEQFIGLYDKSGQEIYEGDIVQPYYSTNVILGDPQLIIYKEHMFAMGDDEKDLSGIWYNIVEVIGNIYENLELLLNK